MGKEYRVLVCGSRDWTNEILLRNTLSEYFYKFSGLVIVEGGAKGADSMASLWAKDFRIKNETYPADWKRHGKYAGFLRNTEMLEKNIDLVLAFQKNKSRGTQDTIDKARKKGIRVVVVEE